MTHRRHVLPWLAGTVAGLAAWVVGYGLTYLAVAPDVRESSLNRIIDAFEGSPATYEMVGWVFYNAHFVHTVFRDLPLFGSHTTSFIGDEGFAVALYAVPIVLLLLSGIVLARYTGVTDPVAGAFAGVTTLPAYLLASIVGVFAFEVTIGSATGGPDLVPALLLAGIAYPLIFGGGGGAITGVVTGRMESDG